MPNIKSAAKRWRQNLRRRARNRAVKSVLRTQARKVRELATAGDLAQAETEFRLACKKFDQAASKGVVHRNLAARMKSRLSGRLKAAKQAKAS